MHAFFFRAEDGIRGRTVTGVQTCALPICPAAAPPGGADGEHDCVEILPEVLQRDVHADLGIGAELDAFGTQEIEPAIEKPRSEERRVGKGWRFRWLWAHECTIAWSGGVVG